MSAEQNNKQAGKERQVDRLGTAKVTKLMVEFAIPAIIGLVVNGLYNIVDSIFLGHAIGDIGLATATIAMPIMVFSIAVSMLIGAGGNALCALKLGEGKHDEVERVISNSFTLTLIAAVLVTVVVNLFMDPILALSGAHDEVWESSHVFVRIISFGFILQFFGMGFNNFLRTAGKPNMALGTMVIGTVICIALNALFVMGFNWGVAGSAWATVIGQGVSALIIFWYFVFSPKAPFKIRLALMRVKPRLAANICSLGSATFVLQIAMVVISLILIHQLVELGAATEIGSRGALAAIGVVQRIAMFTFFPIMGVAIACQPMFGYNYGACNYARVKQVFNVGFVWVAVIGVVFWLLIHIFPSQIVYIFGMTGDLLSFTITVLQVMMFCIPVMGLQLMAANYFQSTGQPLKSMFLSLTRQLLYLIPLIYFLPHVITAIGAVFGLSLGPLDGVYYAYPIADLISVFTAALFMFIEFKRLNAKIAEQQTRA